MKKSIATFLVLVPALLCAQNLKELIDLAQKHNDLVTAKKYNEASKAQALDSQKSSYYPTVDIGGFYKRDDAATPFQAGDIYSAFAKVGFDIYDGGKRSALVDEKAQTLQSAAFETTAYKKSLALGITQDFFAIKSLQASLNAREEAQKTLKAQLEKITKFYEAKMATIDDVQRVQADYDTNIYNIETIKFDILSLKSKLELTTGAKIKSFEATAFKKEENENFATLENIQAIIAQKNAINAASNAVDSFYYPNIRIEDTFSVYGYDRLDPQTKALANPLDNQNKIMLTVNMRLFDFGQISSSKEAVRLNAKVLNAQINYQTKEQQTEYELAKARIATAKLKILSAKSALNAAKSAFHTIEKKYNAGIVDYIIYLDALTKKTSSKALYESSLNDLEVAYATYYYYSGKNIQEEIK
ncbi:TolC family protein [Sulfurimonas sp.]|uniref:TolC family protein n=1 Tax=Sulfurimonas sp. TaxID=2022749 RepID=UPI002626C213|nr:TolC family protein [Sulfurimonas sp.]